MNLYKINLNLLKTFVVLTQEKNVSRAAKVLHITQPAISNSLNQLRELFADELFIRAPKQMVPTQKALQLAPRIEQALRELEATVFDTEEFDYKTSNRTFTLGMSDYAEFVLLPKLYSLIKQLAPHVCLKIRTFNDFSASDFEECQLEIGIGLEKKFTRQLRCERLFTDGAVCVANEKHAIFKSPLTLKRYLKVEHLAVCIYSSTLSRVDESLNKAKLQRSIKVSLPDILPALQMLSTSQLVGTLSQNIAREAAKTYRLKYVKSPIDIPDLHVAQVWHRQQDNDSGLIWLRGLIKKLCIENFHNIL